MPQFYYKNGKLYISEDEGKTGAALYPKKNGNITFGGTNYYKPKLHAESINNSFTPVTEQQINTFRSKLNNNFFDAMKYASKEMQSTNPKKKINVTSSNSSTPSNSSTSPKRTQYQLPEGVKTRDDIIKIQQMLADANMLNGTNKYNLGTYGAKGNGVDGIWGAKTDAAYKQYLKDQADYHTNNIETEPIKVNTPFQQLKPVKGVRISPDYSTPLMPSFNQFTLPWRNVWDDIKAGRRDSWIDYAKRGGIVRKFQEGNKFNFIKAEDIFKKTTDAIKEQDRKIQQVKKAASQPKKKSNNKVTTANTTAQLQLALYNAGMFNGIKKNGKQVSFEQAVDGLSGNLTNQAIKNAQKAGYNVDTNAGIISKQKKQKLFPEKTVTQSSIMSPFSKLKDELQKAIQNDQTYTEIDPRDYKEFGRWLYNEGASHSIGNAFNTAGALTKNFLGLGNNISLGEGAQQQAIALHLFDDHNKIKTEDGIKHIIDKDKNGDYRWQQINGGENVHNDRSIFSKALSQPGMHILGQYTTFESPEGYRIIDTYNFNKSGTDYAKNKINSDKSTSYDYLRYQAGEYGQNKDLKIDQFIPKEKVLNWYNEFKSGKGVAERTKNILNEYNNKGYVGSGRQTYL